MAWRYRSLLSVRLWADIVSYSGLAHGILWTLNGLVLGTACGLLVLVSPRMRRTIAPGAFAVAILAAGISVLLLWPLAHTNGLTIARGLNGTWCLLVVGWWLVATVAGYAAAKHLGSTRLGALMQFVGRVAFAPAAIILLPCLVVQYVERPKLTEPTTRWKQAISPPSNRQDPRPNVVLVVLDTQRADRLGCYGYDRGTSPRLDAFAADALVFEDCLSPGIWTAPSHASIFCGLFPSTHGVGWLHIWLDERFVTLAELLSQAGYRTAAFSNNSLISPATNLSKGFEELIRPVWLHRARSNSLARFLGLVLYDGGCIGRLLGALTAEDAGAKYTNQLIARWLDRTDRRRPLFLFINYMEPHAPYRPHLPHRELFVKPEDIDSSYRNTWLKSRDEFSLLKRDCYTQAELQLLNDIYDGETRLLDDYIGELLEVLAERLPLDETLILITSDHGESLGEHHIIGHRFCVYDTLAHVPLIVRYPKRVQPGRSNALVQTVDLLPTVMDAVHGRPVPTASTLGRSLLNPPGAIRQSLRTSRPATTSSPATAPAGRATVIELLAPGMGRSKIDPRFSAARFQGPFRAIRQGPWKYILAPDGQEELYNIANDPRELHNLIETHRPVGEQLAERLRRWVTTVRKYEERPPKKGEPSPDCKTRRHLRDLGYIQ